MLHVKYLILSSYEEALKELVKNKLKHPYHIEEGKKEYIGGYLQKLPKTPLKHVKQIEVDQEINWDSQLTHSPYYTKEGIVEVPLSDFHPSDKVIKLCAGPGFGDLSHPTTQLMLENMAPYVRGKDVVDIGSGNGILTFASLFFGARSALGLEIDLPSLEHSKKNALLNDLRASLFSLPKDTSNLKDPIFLINMTFLEQKEVFKTLSCQKGTFLISGLLKGQEESYLDFFPFNSKNLFKTLEKSGWVFLAITV